MVQVKFDTLHLLRPLTKESLSNLYLCIHRRYVMYYVIEMLCIYSVAIGKSGSISIGFSRSVFLH
jgi:hypothetical protein